MVLSVIYNQSCTSSKLHQTSNIFSEIVSCWAYLKSISYFQVLLCLFGEEFARLKHSDHVFSVRG